MNIGIKSGNDPLLIAPFLKYLGQRLHVYFASVGERQLVDLNEKLRHHEIRKFRFEIFAHVVEGGIPCAALSDLLVSYEIEKDE